MSPSDQNQILYPDAAQRIMDLIKTTFGSTFTYFLGMPDTLIPPQDAYPCVVVDKDSGTFKVGPTTADDITERVFVYVLVDVKTGFGSPDDDNTVKRQLQTYIEGRDPTTGQLLPNTFMFALRTNLTLSDQDVPAIVTINNDIDISYNSAQRPNMPETQEAVIDILVTERQEVFNRR